MQMNKKKRVLIGIIMFATIGILGQTSRVEAALQANGGTAITANLNDWIKAVRQMQATGGTLGLTDTINTNLTSSNKNMDIHMQKNTEYGAMAILSASAYGNPNKITDGQTTTGNASGIQIKLNEEWVVAAQNDTLVENMKNAVGRYWNNYGTGDGSNSKSGDAMAETNGWHGSSGNSWLRHTCFVHPSWRDQADNTCAFVRAINGAIFGFNGYAYDSNRLSNVTDGIQKCWIHGRNIYDFHTWQPAAVLPGNYLNSHYGRACVVVGSGV